MQMGVEIHLHQGKPGVRAANTHCVDQAFPWLITQSRVLERLFEHGLSYTSGPTVRQANVRRGTTNHRRLVGALAEAPGSLAQARYILQTSKIALRRTEPGWRAAVLDERASEEGSGYRAPASASGASNVK
jgi:hypothetical protein